MVARRLVSPSGVLQDSIGRACQRLLRAPPMPVSSSGSVAIGLSLGANQGFYREAAVGHDSSLLHLPSDGLDGIDYNEYALLRKSSGPNGMGS